MSRLAEIIPLASRRHGPPTPPGPTSSKRPRDRRAWLALLVLFGLLAVPLAMMVVEGGPRSIAGLAPSERAAIFQRAYDDLRATCALPAATNGALRERCRSTASFVVLFPECDDACARTARALLPQARR